MAAEMAAATAEPTSAEPGDATADAVPEPMAVAVAVAGDAMSALSTQAEARQGGPGGAPRMMFVPASDTNRLSVVTDPKAENASDRPDNSEEIDIDDQEEEEEEEDKVRLQQKQVPDAVFGRLAASMHENSNANDSQPPAKAARLH